MKLGVAKKISKLPSRRGLQKNHAQLQFYKGFPCKLKMLTKNIASMWFKSQPSANHVCPWASKPCKSSKQRQAAWASRPSKEQVRQLTSQPTNQPILKPLLQSCWSLPTKQPTNHPTNQQTNQITNQPATQPTIKKRVKRNSRYQPCAELNTKNSSRWQLNVSEQAT